MIVNLEGEGNKRESFWQTLSFAHAKFGTSWRSQVRLGKEGEPRGAMGCQWSAVQDNPE